MDDQDVINKHLAKATIVKIATFDEQLSELLDGYKGQTVTPELVRELQTKTSELFGLCRNEQIEK